MAWQVCFFHFIYICMSVLKNHCASADAVVFKLNRNTKENDEMKTFMHVVFVCCGSELRGAARVTLQ